MIPGTKYIDKYSICNRCDIFQELHVVDYINKSCLTVVRNVCPTCHNMMADVMINDDVMLDWISKGILVLIEPRQARKCTCGGDKCHTTHSHWCDKYDKNRSY
jgi:hypothetical protein